MKFRIILYIVVSAFFKKRIIKHWEIQNRKEDFLNMGKKGDKHVQAFWELIGIP